MKFASALLALLGSAAASPVALTESTEHQLEKRQTINYVQNYNGNLAHFSYDQSQGNFHADWNNPSDFVVGLGWSTGTSNRYESYNTRQ
jgi:endo-1,4-beta-xylanase